MWLQSIVGISVVFLALIALSFAIYVFGKVMVNGKVKRKEKPMEMKLENVESVEVEADVADDGELIAVITAAIQASLANAGISPECKIVVKSFKRVDSGAPLWNATNRKELLN
jgi:sodium pump decarboxylase gamma subunit